MSGSTPSRSRTVLLSLVVVLSVIVLALVGFLVFRGQQSTPAADSTASSTTETSTPSSSTTTSEVAPSSPPSTRTTKAVDPGSVVYQLTGSGDVVGLSYRTGEGREVVAATGTPWSVSTTVSGRRVEMTAVVVRGPVTCTILHGEKLIASSTSNGGGLRCSGKLPN